jgi:hypothetical protein
LHRDHCQIFNVTKTVNFTVCELVGSPDFSFAKYAEEENFSQQDVVDTITPVCYSCAVACTMCVSVIMGGSNGAWRSRSRARVVAGSRTEPVSPTGAKYMYHQNVMSRQDEAAGQSSGKLTADMRRDAMTKKVRGQREGDIKAASAALMMVKIRVLEEAAMMMEFATGVPMEQHYDLVAHDDIMTQIKKAAEIEDRAGNARLGLVRTTCRPRAPRAPRADNLINGPVPRV